MASPRLFLALALVCAAARADVSLAPLFADHAVLQRDKPARVWGHADPGEHVTVNFRGQAVEANAGADGSWAILLAPPAADASGADLVAAGRTSVTIHDVVTGEVWICAGRLAMDFRAANPRTAGSHRHERPPPAAVEPDPMIRTFFARSPADKTPNGAWAELSAEGNFAAGYFFARDIRRRLGIPVGIIESASDGASACAIRGVLWQGSGADAGRASDIRQHFGAMISAWRAQLGQGDVPFYWVQAGRMQASVDPTGEDWAYVREAQSRALTLPASGQAVTIDISDPDSTDPSPAQEIGHRLALIAKANAYGIPGDFSGPVFAGAVREGAAMRVSFKFADNGLTAADKPLQSFELAGADQKFHTATAAIAGNAVIVRSPEVPVPVAVRYAWRNAPEANLFNGAGLPAMPFRSDDW